MATINGWGQAAFDPAGQSYGTEFDPMQVVSMIVNRTHDSCAKPAHATHCRHAVWTHCATWLLAGLVCLSLSASARAVIVGNVPNVRPDTAMNPVNYAGWTQGDPGFNNVTADGSNYVYLGDGWVLSARHVGYSSSAGVQLQTYLPNGTPGPVKTFFRIPGNYYKDYGYAQGNTYHYAVSNQHTITAEEGHSVSLIGSDNKYFTDLQLFRISEDPGLPALTISSQSLGSDFTRATAPEVVAIGSGRNRQVPEIHYNVTKNSSTNWTWTPTSDTGDYQGYLRTSGYQKRFGTNRITDPHPNYNTDPSDPDAENPSDDFKAIVSDTSGVFRLTTSDGIARDLVAMMTTYNRQSAPGATPLEFQAVAGGQGNPGNSGSGVFYKRGDQWELAGIIHAIIRYEDQPANNGAVYGNSTIISDLSYYNQDYPGSIRNIMNTHVAYSINGDVNLDGVFTGNGTGSAATDDLTAFIEGWRFDNHLGVGTVSTWRKGDLNRDGKTDVRDFLLMREALNGQVPQVMITALFGNGSGPPDGTVPEPSAIFLIILGASSFAFLPRRRRAGALAAGR